MSLSPLAFSGVSSFSESFQTILNRSQQIASLPLTRLQNDRTDLIQRKTLVTALEGVVGAFTASLRNLGSVGDRAGVTGSSSDTSKVRISSATATSPAQYTIANISSLAAAASETSVTGYASASEGPVSATGLVRLTVGSQTYDINLAPEQNNLAGLRNAINALGAGVTATIFTTGTGELPNFLSVSATETGAKTLSLLDDPDGASTSLLTSANQGSNAVFQLNGVTVSKPSNLINDVVSGVSFTILGLTEPSATVTIKLASDRNQLATALESIAGAFNSVVDFLDSQIGESAGLLSGSNLIFSTSGALRQFTSFNGSGAIQSLSALGLTLDSTGKMTFDSTAFSQLSDTQIGAAFEFAGTSVNGVASLVGVFDSIANPVTGAAKIEQTQFAATETRLISQIEALTDRVTAQQEALRQRLQMADTLLASLESQRVLLDAQLESLKLTLYGKRDR
jgi:flagellar hook-associated protein 2